ncbi:MAG TPA: hypothetical protein VKA34_00440, partial [Balneolales bacterium]|nr:hypothetical protein [Balneolales bacterium]
MKKKIIRLSKPIIEHFSKLAMTYKYIRDQRQIYDKPRETVMGFKLVGYKLMQNGQFEPKEMGILKKILSNVDIVINVGANIGYYCCIALNFWIIHFFIYYQIPDNPFPGKTFFNILDIFLIVAILIRILIA